jgi:cysteine desulfurase
MRNTDRIYLDYAASTPVDPRVMQLMAPYFSDTFGNSTSAHFWGQQADAALEEAREVTSGALHALQDEIVFTSCGSESDNLALRGTAIAERDRRGANHILVSPVEHQAVLATARDLQAHYGFQLEYIPVDEFGQVNPEVVGQMIRKETAIVSVIYANNEIGTINPISEIGDVCRQKCILFHTDAVQAAAYLSVDVNTDNVDMLSIGAHKFYGPKGVGALFVRKGISIFATQTGGGQERSMRAGTHNLPLIIGMAEALKITQLERKDWMERLSGMRNRIIHDVLINIPQARLTGHPDQRLPNHASFAFDGVDGNLLIMLLDVAGFACSSGSACKSGTPKPSSVLKALGLSEKWTTGALRVTLGRHTTDENITAFLKALPGLVDRAKLIV